MVSEMTLKIQTVIFRAKNLFLIESALTASSIALETLTPR